jgi:large subunit ribosomal protein L18e
MGKHARDIVRKNNPQLVGLVNRLYTLSSTGQSKLWRNVARRLEGPSRERPSVNLSKLERYCADGDTLLIPGKLL